MNIKLCNKPCNLLAAVLAASMSISALAENHAHNNSANYLKNDIQEEVIVTATRTAQSLADSLATATVLDADDIKRLQAPDLTSLLSGVPGMNFSHSGGPGSTTDIFLRGTSPSQVLFLVDGVRVNSATTGTTNFQYLDPEQIERIEVVPGIRSTLYGSDAVGGVIQIFTKKGADDFHMAYKTGVGKYGLHENSVNLSGAMGDTSLRLGLNNEESNGFDRTEDNSRTSGDNDAYRNSSISANIQQVFTDKITGGIQYSRNKGKTEYDSDCYTPAFSQVDCSPYSYFDIESVSTSLNIKASEILTISLLAGHSSDLSQNRDKLVDPSTVAGSENEFKTTRDSYLWQNDFDFGGQILTIGYDYYKDEVDATFDNDMTLQESTRFNKAGFVQYQMEIAGQSIALGARHDDNEQYGEQDTWSVSWGTDLNDTIAVFASIATGFQAPSFNALYWPLSSNYYDFIGNPDLDPEESENLEVGLKGTQQWGTWQVSVYEYTIDDLIVNGPIDGDLLMRWSSFNMNKAEIEGMELSLQTELIGWTIRSSYSFVNARDEETNNFLNRRPMHTVAIDVDRQISKFQIGLTWLTQSERYDDPANEERLGGYGTLDARIQYQATQSLLLALKVNNLLDKDYALARTYSGDYETAGLNALVSATIEF